MAVSRIQTRRLLLQGASLTYELLPEWGLNSCADAADNFHRLHHLRTSRRTEFSVLEHVGPLAAGNVRGAGRVDPAWHRVPPSSWRRL